MQRSALTLGPLRALQHMECVAKELQGSRGTLAALQGTQRVGGAWLAPLPVREQQPLALATQHKLGLQPTAADLWGEEQSAAEASSCLAWPSGRRRPGLSAHPPL